MSWLRRFRDAGLSVVLLALPFFFLRANLRDPSRADFMDRWILDLSAPVQWMATQLADGVSSVVEEYVYLVEVQRENERLAGENQQLQRRLEKLEALDTENRRLRSLLVLRERLGGEEISARVIAKEISPLFHVVRVKLDRGEDDRVKAGMAVVTPEGLVGQIAAAEGRYSNVLLTVDDGSAVDVVVQRTGSRGILRGTGERDRYKTRIQYLARGDEVRVGDTVYTSGLGQRFPADVKVGTISKVERKDFGLYQLAEVTPAVKFSRLEEVLILTEGTREAASEKRGSRSRRGGRER